MSDSWRTLWNCDKKDCLNHSIFALKVTEKNDGFSIGVRPTNVKMESPEQTTGIMLTCLLCQYNKPRDMYMQKSLIVQPSKLI